MVDISAIMLAQLRATVEGSNLIESKIVLPDFDNTEVFEEKSNFSIVSIFYFCFGFIILLFAMISRVVFVLAIIIMAVSLFYIKSQNREELRPKHRGKDYYHEQKSGF